MLPNGQVAAGDEIRSAYVFEGNYLTWFAIFTDPGLKQEGNRLPGTAGPAESQQMPIKTGKAEGDHLVFEVDMGGGTIAFDLKSVGAELQGEMRLSEGGRKTAARVTLKRA